ncbi:MAG: hypothetical protein J1F36_04650 [Clostridiales bacterium]|nr:hypothetical protein [Clostridiales bacterium]
MKLIIKQKIDEYTKSAKQRFHTPGHKGELCISDITEIDDTFPGSVIDEAQNNTARLLGSKYCRYLVGGSSMGIKAAVLAAGGDILVAANSHRALFEAARLTGVNAFTVQNEVKDDLAMPLTAMQVEEGLKAHPSVKAVYITSPDYYGFAASGEIAEVVKNRAYLFCDGAHGAHFPFRQDLFPKSFSMFADVVNLSAHKTLPAYTQSAYLAVNNDELIDRIDDALKLLGTTSPSYVLLSGLEYAAEYTKEFACRYDELKNRIAQLKKSAPIIANDDFTRVVVDAKRMGLSGKELYFRLKSRGIVAEKFDDRYVVFIVTLIDTPQKIDLLKEELCAVSL